MVATARAVDLTNVKEGSSFRPKRKPEGDYKAKVVKADDHIKQGNEPGWVLTVQVDGDARSTYPIYLNPAEKQAWKIRQVCIACGLNVKTARIKFDPNKLVGKALGVVLEDDEYEGKLKSSIAEAIPVSEVGANADEIDVDEDEVPEDEEVVEDEEEEEEPPAPPARKRRAKVAPEPEPELDDEDEEEEEEEAPAPPPRRRRAAAPATKPVASARRTRKPAPEPVEEDDDLDLDDLDD